MRVSTTTVIVFKGGCTKLEHVGVVFKNNRRILQLDSGLDIASDQKLKNNKVFDSTLEKTFPNSTGVEFKMHVDEE